MHTYTWIKFIIFSLACLGSAIGFLYYVSCRRSKTTRIKTWKMLLYAFVLFLFIAERYYTALFE